MTHAVHRHTCIKHSCDVTQATQATGKTTWVQPNCPAQAGCDSKRLRLMLHTSASQQSARPQEASKVLGHKVGQIVTERTDINAIYAAALPRCVTARGTSPCCYTLLTPTSCTVVHHAGPMHMSAAVTIPRAQVSCTVGARAAPIHCWLTSQVWSESWYNCTTLFTSVHNTTGAVGATLSVTVSR